jgi:ankyrin repeat protein
MLPNYQLLHAIQYGCLDDFNEAFSRGASVEATDLQGRGVLEVAMQTGHHEMARRLIRNGADPNRAIGKRNDRLIHLAARTGNIGLMKIFLEAGVDANSSGTRRRTPLHLVANRGFEFMACLLLDEGANPDATDDTGNTPLHLVANKGDLAMTKLLLKHHATATKTNDELYTPIHNAVANGHTEAAQTMMRHEDSLSTHFRASAFPDRIRRVAERHGQMETAEAIRDTWLDPA